MYSSRKKIGNPKPTLLIADHLYLPTKFGEGRLNNNGEQQPPYTWGRLFFGSPAAVH